MKRSISPHGIKTGVYRSLFESEIAIQLRHVKFEYEPKDKRLHFVEERNYLPDFYLPEYNIYIETKGYFMPSDRSKMKMIKTQHPEVKIILVFMNANTKLNKSSKTTYGEWATKNGFIWFDKQIPKDIDFSKL